MATSKSFARRLFRIGENRLELLIVEIQEERQHLLHFLLLALGVAVFGILAGVALSLLIVVSLWERSPAAALLVLTSFYAAAAVFLCKTSGNPCGERIKAQGRGLAGSGGATDRSRFP